MPLRVTFRKMNSRSIRIQRENPRKAGSGATDDGAASVHALYLGGDPNMLGEYMRGQIRFAELSAL
jgi:hypothetical protein